MGSSSSSRDSAAEHLQGVWSSLGPSLPPWICNFMVSSEARQTSMYIMRRISGGRQVKKALEH